MNPEVSTDGHVYSRWCLVGNLHEYVLFFTNEIILYIGIVVCLIVYGWKDVLSFITQAADNARDKAHVLDGIFFFFLILVVGVLAFPGISMLELTCGFVLGFTEAFIVSTLAVIIASCVAYGIGRYYLRNFITAYLDESEHHSFKRFLQSIERRNGYVFLILFRLMFVPLFVKNYGPSVIKTDFQHYLVAVLVTTPLYSAMLSFVGSRAKTIADIAAGNVIDSDQTVTWVEVLPLVLSVLAALAFTWIAYAEFQQLTSGTDEETQPVLDIENVPDMDETKKSNPITVGNDSN